MKPVLLILISFLFLESLAAQANKHDSITAEIESLQKLRTELSRKADVAREQLNEKFTLSQAMKERIEQINITLKKDKSEFASLQKKDELTSQEKKWLSAYKNTQKEKEKYSKSLLEMEESFNMQLGILDEVIGLQNEIEKRISELKTLTKK
jgi:hypothetical protein